MQPQHIVFRRTVSLLVAIAVALTATRCKREPDGPDNSSLPPERCRIAAISFQVDSKPQAKYFSYDNDGRLITVRTLPARFTNDINLNFLYPRADSVFVQHLDEDGSVSSTDSIKYDALGRVVRISYSSSADAREYLRFCYGATSGNLDSATRDIYFSVSGMYLPVVWYYRWQDGNLISDSTFVNGALNYSYYPGTVAQGPEYDLANEYRLLERPYARSRNLRRTIGNRSPLLTHRYAFDAGGKMIADSTGPPADVHYETYTYECK